MTSADRMYSWTEVVAEQCNSFEIVQLWYNGKPPGTNSRARVFNITLYNRGHTHLIEGLSRVDSCLHYIVYISGAICNQAKDSMCVGS